MNNNSCSKWGNTMQDHMEHINREVANAASLSEIEKLLSCLLPLWKFLIHALSCF
jgi:hypothetical protein